MAAAALALLLLALLPADQALATAAGDAHPCYQGSAPDTCGGAAGRRYGPALEEYAAGSIVDITHAYRSSMPAFAPGAAVGPLVRLKLSMLNGSEYNLSELRMECHMGTHVDAPGHMNQAHFAAGLDVDTLDLAVLNGPALLVDVPRHTNITAQAMKSLNIRKGVRRVLFRTLNTDMGLMWKAGGDMSYVGFTEDGAQWLVDNTDIKLVGPAPWTGPSPCSRPPPSSSVRGHRIRPQPPPAPPPAAGGRRRHRGCCPPPPGACSGGARRGRRPCSSSQVGPRPSEARVQPHQQAGLPLCCRWAEPVWVFTSCVLPRVPLGDDASLRSTTPSEPDLSTGYHPSRSPETRQRQNWTVHASLLTSKTGWIRGCTNQVHSYQVIT